MVDRHWYAYTRQLNLYALTIPLKRVQNGTWNMLRKKMVSPRKLACWAIVVFDSRFNPQHAQALASKLAGVMEERGE